MNRESGRGSGRHLGFEVEPSHGEEGLGRGDETDVLVPAARHGLRRSSTPADITQRNESLLVRCLDSRRRRSWWRADGGLGTGLFPTAGVVPIAGQRLAAHHDETGIRVDDDPVGGGVPVVLRPFRHRAVAGGNEPPSDAVITPATARSFHCFPPRDAAAFDLVGHLLREPTATRKTFSPIRSGRFSTEPQSSVAWAWSTSKAAPGAAGTVTSPSSPPPRVPHPATARPKRPDAGLTLYQVLEELQDLLRCGTGGCTTCGRPLPTSRTRT